jgi:site-specific recombinase XerD
MDITDLKKVIPSFMKRLKNDGHSKEILLTNTWIVNHFINYCELQSVSEITMDTLVMFLKTKYAIELYQPICGSQISIRRPLLILWEYYHTGTYQKSHLYEKSSVPEAYKRLYLDYCSHLNSLALDVKTKSSKARYIKQFFEYLSTVGKLNDITFLKQKFIYSYLESKSNYTSSTLNTIKYNLRSFLNWLNNNNVIAFSGNDAFPKIRTNPRKFLPSCYSNQEIRKLLDCVDPKTSKGKHDYLVLVLSIYYGLRVSDLIGLKFENFDWNKNQIKLIQKKTKKLLVLPLIDEVRFPLIDYLKNSRPKVDDDHILITLCAPFTSYAKNQSLQRIVTKYMQKADIDFSYRHHGTHALRYSLASGMLNENIPISSISGVLGHGTISTTNLYLTLNENDFRKISLEVPDVSED